MFEVIGKVTVFVLFFSVIFLQYLLMITGVVRKDLNKIEKTIGWIPLLPFILMFLVFIIFIIENMWYSFKKWFEINLGWFFINGRKQNQWGEYLRDKYGNDK